MYKSIYDTITTPARRQHERVKNIQKKLNWKLKWVDGIFLQFFISSCFLWHFNSAGYRYGVLSLSLHRYHRACDAEEFTFVDSIRLEISNGWRNSV